jgi:hypothetical protein
MRKTIQLKKVLIIMFVLSMGTLLAGCELPGGSKMHEEDLVLLVNQNRLPSQMMNDIAYQVAKSQEKAEQPNIMNPDHLDALSYWKNAEMIIFMGMVALNTPLEVTPAPGVLDNSVIDGARVWVAFHSFSEDGSEIIKSAYAELRFKENHWDVKKVEVQDGIMSELASADLYQDIQKWNK